LVALAYFLPGWAKDLSAPPRSVVKQGDALVKVLFDFELA